MRAAARVMAFLAVAGSVASARPKPKPADKPKPQDTKPPEPEKPAEKPAPPAPPPPGPGDRRRIVGVLDVRVEGVPSEVAQQFQTNLEAQLDSREYWLAPASRMHDLMANSTKWTEGCLVGLCLSEVKVQTGADLVLLAALNGSGTSFGYVVTLVRTDTGRMLAQESERCDVCTVNEALTNATLAAVKLLTAVPDKLPDEAAENREKMDLATKKFEGDKQGMHHHHKKVAMVVTMAGLAVAAAGAAVYFVKDHASYGLGTAAAGVGIAAGGLVILTF